MNPLTPPNLVTLLRIALIPGLVICSVEAREVPALRWVALCVLLVSLASDVLDGWLARRRGQTSPLGAFLDPLADKLLFTALFICLALPIWPSASGLPGRLLPLWAAVVVISRDLYISLGALIVFMAAGGVQVHPSRCGKLATVVFAALGVAALAGLPFLLKESLMWASAALAWVTWIQYTTDGMRQLASARPPMDDSPRVRAPGEEAP